MGRRAWLDSRGSSETRNGNQKGKELGEWAGWQRTASRPLFRASGQGFEGRIDLL